ncbi:MAG: DUF58 domain-containing protein [Oscillospiraceae bacterium]
MKPGDDPSEMFGIHEYKDGDKISRIHWKLTAKHGTVFIKDYSLPVTRSTIVVCDLSADEKNVFDAFDRVAGCAAAISRFLISAEEAHTLAWYDPETDRCALSDTDDFDSLQNSLAKLCGVKPAPQRGLAVTQLEKSFFGETTHFAHMIVVTEAMDEKTAAMLIASGRANRCSVFLTAPDAPKSAVRESNNALLQYIRVNCDGGVLFDTAVEF